MNLNDLLKVNNVRCVKTKVDEDLVEGKIYKLEGFDDETIKIVDRGFSSWHNKNLFEPVLNNDVSKSDNEIDMSESSVDDVNTTFKVKCVDDDYAHLTIGKEYDVVDNDYGVYQVKNDNDELEYYVKERFEIVETPKDKQEFSVGDKVYVGLTGKIAQVTKIIDDEVVNVANKNNEVRVWISNICHATQENYEMLCKLYQHIEFELPHKEKTLTEKRYDVIKKLYDSGDIVVVRYGDYESNMIMVGILESLDSLKYPYPYTVVKNWKFAYAVDRKGIEITEDVLNDIN